MVQMLRAWEGKHTAAVFVMVVSDDIIMGYLL